MVGNGKSKTAVKTRYMVMTAFMAVIMVICSWITIPMVVPFTLQTFAVFFALLFLGGTYGTLSIFIYITNVLLLQVSSLFFLIII